ncbi:hypothetical protein AGRA3207_007511 [Actinomadura graeca]|uniref:Uncharacterized protein n=1 Tax=Actinomadura graeca TaxID=2750812 RepID=A0ABX8R7L6_9ACTN|nr:hypothetical protein [Actinomadura graeca]QXJ25942.1 hypothetical protein AGRA3207_007511 [Actinomadura graeca]
MPISVARRQATAALAREFPDARIIDVTSRAEHPWERLSPCYPHGGIPVPFSPSQSVEGIWQALKVFQTAGADPAKLTITTMRGLKRTSLRHGPPLGHRPGLAEGPDEGPGGVQLLDEESARRRIFLPAYRWMLRHRTAPLIRLLSVLAARDHVVLLDLSTNGDVSDLSAPLSHAALITLLIQGTWPEEQ